MKEVVEMKKKTLLLDIDEVFCFCGFLEAVNEFLGTNYEIDDFTNYYIDEAAIPKERMEEFNNFIKGKNMYENPFILPGAIEGIRALSEEYDIYVCSSCINPFDIENSGRRFADKYDMLLKYLPFLDPGHFIFTSAKHMFKADVQIDDRLSNFDESIETKILFPSYHNKDITDEELASKGAIRAGYDWREGWANVLNILLSKDTIKRLKLQREDN